MRPFTFLIALCMLAGLSSCAHPISKLKNINLGMTPADVEAEMGKRYYVRSAKLFAGEETTMVWEYYPSFINSNQQLIHVIFENGRVVQWGVPGDYNTGSASKVIEYKENKGK